MPTFLNPEAGLELSAALAELAIAANVGRIRFETYELWHPSMAVPIRVVSDTDPLVATLEDTAPRNAGEEVTFRAVKVQSEVPSETDSPGEAQLFFTVDNVAGDIKAALDLARQATDPAVRDAQWQIIERVYVSSDLSAPHIRPVFKCTAVQVLIKGNAARFTASYRDSASTAIPAITFTPERYPSLAV